MPLLVCLTLVLACVLLKQPFPRCTNVRCSQNTNISFSHVQIVEEDHEPDAETREACKEIEFFLKCRDK